MKHKCIINLKFGIHESLRGGFAPTYVYSGEAIKVIEGDSVEECLSQVKDLLRKSGFSLLKEQPSVDPKRRSAN